LTPTTSGPPLSSAHIIAAFDAIRDYREAAERAVVDEQRARFQARIDEIESRRAAPERSRDTHRLRG